VANSGTARDYDEIPLRNLPSGLSARVRRTLRADADGRTIEVRDRRGRQKLESVYLFAPNPDPAITPSERELTFLLGARRRTWSTIVSRYKDTDTAWQRTCELARHGAVEIECTTNGFAIASPVCWRLTERWQRRRDRTSARRARERADWERRAVEAADLIEARFPQLAIALRRERGPVVRPVLVYASEDLIDGRSYFGPRAFSQAHFATTKVRDDVSRILTRCEVEVEAQVELGILRSGRTGLAGPVALQTAEGALQFSGIRGPTDVRLDQPALSLTCTASVLAVIENRQAAEAASDRFPGVGLFWTAGLMSAEALFALGQLASQTRRVIVCTDADLGGVRIVEQVLSVAPEAKIIDIGAWPHKSRPPWKTGSISEIGLRAATTGAAGLLAQVCLARGYPVEQELAAIDALAHELAAAEAGL
jgi:hypothetical protein